GERGKQLTAIDVGHGRISISTGVWLGFCLPTGMGYHFTFVWFFALNELCRYAYTFVSGDWRHLAPNRLTPSESWLVDLRITRTVAKFNGAQRFAYTGMIPMGTPVPINFISKR